MKLSFAFQKLLSVKETIHNCALGLARAGTGEDKLNKIDAIGAAIVEADLRATVHDIQQVIEALPKAKNHA